MTEPGRPTLPPWAHTLAFASATAVLTFIAGQIMFSAFMFYDDEGYVLISLKNFAEHGGLYREIYSQYGPFPFVAWLGLHAIGVPIDHASGRWLTLGMWAASALSCAAIVRLGTRSLTASLAVLAATFAYLWVMASEPAHPGGIVGLLVALMAVCGYRWLVQERTRAWAIGIGAGAAALLLTKINVGGFAAMSGLAWILAHHRNDFVRRWSPLAIGAGVVVVPFALMGRMLHEPWILTFVTLYVPAGIAAVIALRRSASPRVDWTTLAWGVGAGALVIVAVTLVVFARGTTPAEMLEGVLLGPLRTPAAFNFRYRWPVGVREFAFVSLAACVGASLLHRRHAARVDIAIAVLRLLAGIALAWGVLRLPAFSPDRPVVSFGAACLWVFFWPLPGENPAGRSAANWIGLLLLGQYLHVYPVAGSQLAWATFLILPFVALGVHGAARHLFSLEALAGWSVSRAGRIGVPALLAVVTATLGWRFELFGARYNEGSDLRLPGVEFLRVPTPTAGTFRLLAANAAVHADMLFSEPGMFSYNLWSGVKPPTLSCVTHWFSLLSVPRQRKIQEALEADPGACVIVARGHIKFLTQYSFPPYGELHEYIARNFTPAFSVDGFEFCVRQGRQIDPVLVGELLSRPDVKAGSPEANGENALLRVRLLGPFAQPVAQVEVRSPNTATPPLILDAHTARVEATPTDVRGGGAGSTRTLAWPFQLAGPTRLQFHFNRFKSPSVAAGSVIIFRGAGGDELALARLPE